MFLNNSSERKPDFVDANVACGRGSKIAFIDPNQSLTYGDLQTCSIRFARNPQFLKPLNLSHRR